jgi:hypothetical protein
MANILEEIKQEKPILYELLEKQLEQKWTLATSSGESYETSNVSARPEDADKIAKYLQAYNNI